MAGGARWWLNQPVPSQVSSGPVDFPFSHQLGRHQQLSGNGPYGFRIVRWEVNGFRPISSYTGLLENAYREALTKIDETWVEIPFDGVNPSEVVVNCPRTATGRDLEVRAGSAIVFSEPLDGLRAEFIDRHNPPSLFEDRNSMLCSRVALYVRGTNEKYVVYEVWLERRER